MAARKRAIEDPDVARSVCATTEIPTSFVRFCREICGVFLTDGQRALWLVGADGSEARGELVTQLFGDIPPVVSRDVFVIVKGARIGGTLLGSLRLLHLALTCPLPSEHGARLASGELPSGIIVAPDQRLARQALRYVTGACEASPILQRLVVKDLADSITLVRPCDGVHVIVECLPATQGGRAIRGRTTVGALLTEAAFFRDDSYKVNDAEIYLALQPRIVLGGQLILESTPFAEAGLLYDLFRDNFGKGTDVLAAHCPTLTMRPDEQTAKIVARERRRDPDNAEREFDAQFMPAGSGLFFDPLSVDACSTEALQLPIASRMGAGADFGFVHDSSALAIVSRDAEVNASYTVFDLREVRPKRGSPLVPSHVALDFASVVSEYGVGSIYADAHYAESIREHLRSGNVQLRSAPGGNEGKAQTYLALKSLIAQRRIRWQSNPRLEAQLKSILSKPLPGGGLSIEAPRARGGGHGDLVSALVLAVWSLRSVHMDMVPRTYAGPWQKW